MRASVSAAADATRMAKPERVMLTGTYYALPR